MINKIHYVYSHHNPEDMSIFYIGVGYNDRCYKFKCGRNKHYLNYIKKHGKPIVKFIHTCLAREEACIIESELILKYGRIGYEPHGILVNKSIGGEKSNYGVKQSLETRDKKSKSMVGKKFHTQFQKDKWSSERKGRIVNKNKDNIKSDKGRPKPKDFGKCRHRKVIQFDLNNIFIKEWDSFREVFEDLKIRNAAIWYHIKNNTSNCGGFIWKYKE
jgi:hypothetical protein